MSAYGESSDWEEIENVCCVCIYMFGRTTIQSGRCWFVRTAVKHTYKHTNICRIVWQTAYQLTDRTRIGGKFKRRKNPKMVLFLPHFDFDFWSSCQQEMNMNFTKLYSLNDCKKTDFLTFPNFHQKYLVPTSRKLAFFDRI